MNAPYLLLLATLLPLCSFLVLIFFGRKMGRFSALVATGAILASFLLSVSALLPWFNKEGQAVHVPQVVSVPWISLAGGTFEVGLLVDSLTLVMFVMITLVATLVHVFSIGYMAGDKRFSRFFAYLGLFCFSMLGLVVSNSVLQVFLFWELVGICSYLLIGFWFENRGPAMASKKAMVTNRIGDMGFLIGLGILVWQLGPSGLTLFNKEGNPQMAAAVAAQAHVMPAHFGPEQGTVTGAFVHEASKSEGSFLEKEIEGPHFLGLSWLTWAGICLFCGAIAKSAQFPLHVWLPDAMEGPTPVSALIHAATMVAAGVYLVARIFPILTLDARLFVAMIGCTTLTMGALIALVMTDIKKVLAYSTISQLGYMILFLGSGAYVAGLFHLITHAFFKACLFLGSGSVILGCHHEQEITKMGGLWRKMPITALTFLISVLAIAGTPLFSGYYSKDLGLAAVGEYAYALPHSELVMFGMHLWWTPRLLFWIPTITAYLTAFYMWRLWWLTFGGKPRNQEIFDHAKESPVMTGPLIILGALAFVAGWPTFRIEELIGMSEPARALGAHPEHEGHGFHMVETYVYWAFLLGPAAAIAIYARGFAVAERIRRLPVINLVYVWLKNKMFFDYLYEGVIVNLCKVVSAVAGGVDKYGVDGIVNAAGYLTRAISWISGRVDATIVDGLVNGLAGAAQAGGRAVMRPQTGRVRFYVLSMVTVVALVVAGLAIYFMRKA